MVLTLRVGAHVASCSHAHPRYGADPATTIRGLVLPGPSAGQQDPCPAQADHRAPCAPSRPQEPEVPLQQGAPAFQLAHLDRTVPLPKPGGARVPYEAQTQKPCQPIAASAQTERRADRTVSIRQGDNHLQKTSEDCLLCAVEEGRGTRQCGPDAQASHAGGTRAPRSGPASSDVPVARTSPPPRCRGSGLLAPPICEASWAWSTSCTSADSPRPREEADAGQETKKAACVHEDNASSCAPYGTDVQGCRSKLTVPIDERCLSY